MTEATIRATEITATDPAPSGTVRRQLRRRGAVALGLLAAVLAVGAPAARFAERGPCRPRHAALGRDALSGPTLLGRDGRFARTLSALAGSAAQVGPGRGCDLDRDFALALAAAATLQRAHGPHRPPRADRTWRSACRISCWF